MSIRLHYQACLAFTALVLLASMSVLSLAAANLAFIPGAEGNGPSIEPAVSADGRYVAFSSLADNLVPGDDNGLQDVFVHDRQTGATTLLSVGLNGEGADGFSEAPAMSADGRFVAFQSVASNLVPYDNNMESDVFVYDREAATLSRASVTSTGAQAAGASYEPDLSADGRFVAFSSTAINLDPADDSPWSDIFVHDRQTGQTTLVSFERTGKRGAGLSDQPVISADGWVVAFASDADDLTPGDTNNYADIFVRDRRTAKTTRVSVQTDGEEVFAESYGPALSADGQVIAFASYAEGLTDETTDGWANVFVHELSSGTTTLASLGVVGTADGDSSRPRLSGDGRLVVFASEAANLLGAPDDNDAADVFLYDRQTGQTMLISRGAGGPGNGESLRPVITTDGRLVAFSSSAANLIADDANGWSDVFVRDRIANVTARASLADGETQPGGGAVYLSPIIR